MSGYAVLNAVNMAYKEIPWSKDQARIRRIFLDGYDSGNGLLVRQVLDTAYASRMIRRIGFPAPEAEFQSGVAGQNVGPSAENPGRTSGIVYSMMFDKEWSSAVAILTGLVTAGQDIRDRLTGAGDPLSRRNLSAGGRHELSRNRTSEDVSLSKDVVPESVVIDKLKKMVENAWKEINDHCLKPTDVPVEILTTISLKSHESLDVIYTFKRWVTLCYCTYSNG
ncbi:casein kinase I-like protein [Tanacetum coccineum]